MLRCTPTERALIRAHVLGFDGALIAVGDNYDGTFYLDVCGITFEAESVPALFKELAQILEES